MRRLVVVCLAGAALALSAAPVYAITFGEPDGTDHPNVGSLVLDVPDLGLFQFCSGTLVPSKETGVGVFLTASHCTDPLDDIVEQFPGTEVLVTFDPEIDEGGTFYPGTWVTNPNYNGFQGAGGRSDPGDVAVVLIEDPGIEPAQLPEAGLLDELAQSKTLKDTRFTAVGYGTVRDTRKGGQWAIADNLLRNRAEQGFNSLTKSWLNLPMVNSPGNENGGTCYGDSGGPHFIHLHGEETNIVVSTTVTGDTPCKASDVTYRMDTESARSFLDDYVVLP
jgi:trypsin